MKLNSAEHCGIKAKKERGKLSNTVTFFGEIT